MGELIMGEPTQRRTIEDDDQLNWTLITLAVLQSDFDLDKTAKRLRATKMPGGKRRIRDALVRWETHITNVERNTHNPETRLAMRRLLAGIRKGQRGEAVS